MKLICNQKILSQKIGIVQKAINSRTTIELLKGILLSTTVIHACYKLSKDLKKNIDLKLKVEKIKNDLKG